VRHGAKLDVGSWSCTILNCCHTDGITSTDGRKKWALVYVLANLYVKEKRFVNLYSLPPNP
ncbi:hypothetical protein KZ866_33100, partial [Pseudomonas aeruginosa]